MTSAEITQLAPLASEPPVRVIWLEPGFAVSTPELPHVPFWPLGSSTTRPAGSVSVMAIPETVDGLGLVIVIDSAVGEPIVTCAGVNALAIVGGGAIGYGVVAADDVAGASAGSTASPAAPASSS